MNGIEGVCLAGDTVISRFYLDYGHGGDIAVLQRLDGEGQLLFAEYAPQSQETVSLRHLEANDVLVALPPVEVRVDPPSLSGTSQTGSLRRATLAVSGDKVIMAIPGGGFRQSVLVDVAAGTILNGRMPTPWATFTGWQLVVREAGEELPIVTFGADT